MDQVFVTCTVNRQHQVTFEIDTGASCNVLPFCEYVKATGDKDGHKLKKMTISWMLSGELFDIRDVPCHTMQLSLMRMESCA